MSSIYKKGRDGYYYYQAYIYNKKSKKKNKRIYHSLNTKDESEARLKQKKLDSKYHKKNKLKKSYFNSEYFSKLYFERILLLIFILLFIKQFIFKDDEKINEKSSNLSFKLNNENLFKVNSIITTEQGIKKNNIINTKSNDIKDKIFVPEIVNSFNIDYSIQRIDRSSKQFQLGKIFITISPNSTVESRLNLCKKIVEDYSEFTNIVICLYSDNKEGKSLANGENDNFINHSQTELWLGMYTYNPVEGEYFDENPNKYQSMFQ